MTHDAGGGPALSIQGLWKSFGELTPAELLSDPHEPRTRQFLNRIIEAGRL